MDGVSKGDGALSKRVVPIHDLGIISLGSVNVQLASRLLGEIDVRREACKLVTALDAVHCGDVKSVGSEVLSKS